MTNVKATLFEGMELSSNDLELLRKYNLGELNEEEFLEIIKNMVTKFIMTNGEEKLVRFLNGILIDALAR